MIIEQKISSSKSGYITEFTGLIITQNKINDANELIVQGDLIKRGDNDFVFINDDNNRVFDINWKTKI